MLKKILSGKACAECRLCCIFDRYDAWETPVFTAELCERIREARPGTEFVTKDGGYIFRVGELRGDELFSCPALTDTGCMLGDDKPFDCRIFPLKIMVLGGRLVITVSPVCPEAVKLPLEELIAEAKRLSARIFAEAQREPDIVRPYEKGYPILVVGDEIQHIQGE